MRRETAANEKGGEVKKIAKVCAECGQLEDLHHAFVAAMPEGCQCAAGEWDDAVNEICTAYIGNGVTQCATCEHDKECHK